MTEDFLAIIQLCHVFSNPSKIFCLEFLKFASLRNIFRGFELANLPIIAICKFIRKNSACCLKIRQFFSQSKRTDRLDLPSLPLFVLVCFLRTPLPRPARRTYFLNDPISNLLLKEFMIRWAKTIRLRFLARISFRLLSEKTSDKRPGRSSLLQNSLNQYHLKK